jgi:diguanylate cyclase (GGDEF)-like protein
MTQSKKYRFTVSNILSDINNSISSNEYSENSDTLFCRFMSPILLLSAICVPIFGGFFLKRPLPGLILDTLVMLFFALSFEILLRVKIQQNIRHHLVSIAFCLTFLFAVLRFYPIVGPALWTFAFIQIIFSLSQNSQIMLVYSAITVTMAGLYVSIFQDQINFTINIYYIITQFVLFALLFIVAKIVYTINSKHMEKSDEQLVLLRSEMAERKKVEEKNTYLAMYDQLTGLPNRTLFCDRLNQAIEFSMRNKLKIYVFFIDIDLFKLINDTLGHSCGDELLIEIGKRLSGILRSSDAVCRVSGDEFLLMLQDVSDSNQIYRIAGRILDRICTPFIINEHHVTVSCSIGISKFPDNGNDAESLIKHADIAMYKAKQDGKNRYAVYSKDLEQMRRNEREIVSALQNALANDEFRLHYQPQVNANTNEVIGYEALIRWEHPIRGFLGAGEIIPAAEKSGLIVPIGEWVLRTACRQNKAWQDSGMKSVPIAVNISIHQMKTNSLYDLVKSVLLETGLEAKYLELEITETTLAKETEDVFCILTKIRELGVKITIDDFGTGYSAIQYLKSYPIDRIKIPIDFIQGIKNSTKDESIITIIIALAESLGIGVVAEGVETENQRDFLLDRSCSTIQGYFFYKPMAADDVEDYARSKSEA